MGYSKDFKDKIIEIMIRDQLSIRKATQHFGVCTRTIQLWKKSTENRLFLVVQLKSAKCKY